MNLGLLQRRWRRAQSWALGFRAVGLALGVGALVWAILPADALRPLAVLGVALAVALASIWLPRPPMATRALMAKHLDRAMPELQDSSDLLVRDEAERTGLELLQVRRIETILADLPESGLWPRRQITTSLRYLLGGIAVTVLVLAGQVRWGDPSTASREAAGLLSRAAEDPGDPLQRVIVEIEPPVYTGQAAWRQESLGLEVAEGSRIRWRLPASAERASLIFAGQEPLPFVVAKEGLELEMEVRESGVYRLITGSDSLESRSSYSRLSVVPDESPKLRFVRPQDRLTSVTQPQDGVDLIVEATDDFGLQAVDLVITLAQGSGEMVEFRQQREPMRPDPSGTEATLEGRLNLSEMGLQGGSEIYFFAEARDNRAPKANVGRTGTYILRVPAEGGAVADLGEGLPIVLPPEYFRSQRQIILDTEKLIADKSDLGTAEFQRRAESLGFDQRALRMRYGTLLGEEFDSGRPVGAGEEEASQEEGHEDEEPTVGDAEGHLEGVPADFVHSHDSAEIATYFTSETRTQLKQVLGQMWEAEGHLRVHQPREALPYEYRALELLKDLQQRSRIYVQKVAFETPPLEPDKIRLTGELEDIESRSRASEQELKDQLSEAIRHLLKSLDEDRPQAVPERDEIGALLRTAIAELASREPEALLALDALDRWIRVEALSRSEQRTLAEALWQLVPDPSSRPGRGRSQADPLTELYRTALSEGVEP